MSKINLSVNQKYGYLSFNVGKLLSLPPIVVRRGLQSLSCHIKGAINVIPRYERERIHNQLVSGDRRIKRCKTNLILFCPDTKEDTMIMGRASHVLAQRKIWTPISVGQTIHWDRRWRITLKPLEELKRRGSKNTSAGLVKKEQLYVRHMKVEEKLWVKSKTEVPASILPNHKLWSGLPVICTESGFVVLAPHFKINDHSYGVDCDITFVPLLPLLSGTSIIAMTTRNL